MLQISVHWGALGKVPNRVLSEQEERNWPLEDNLVLLQDHPKGHDKIQDHFTDQECCGETTP